MKNFSRSLARSRSSQAFVALSAASTDSPAALYKIPNGMRHRKFRIDFDGSPEERYSRFIPEDRSPSLPCYRLSGFDEGVVASASGVECRSTVASDSPTLVLEFARHLAERVQDIFSSRGYRLLLIQNVSGVAVLCAQAQ